MVLGNRNTNESLNSVIWKLDPKLSVYGPRVAQIPANEAVTLFNKEQIELTNTMQLLGCRLREKITTVATEGDNR